MDVQAKSNNAAQEQVNQGFPSTKHNAIYDSVEAFRWTMEEGMIGLGIYLGEASVAPGKHSLQMGPSL